MLERMGIQRNRSAIEDVSQVLFQYAELTRKGIDPTEAMMAVAKTMENKRKGVTDQPVDPLMQAGEEVLPSDTSTPTFG